MVFAHELGHLRDFQDDCVCCLMDREEKEARAREFALEVLEQWERGQASRRLEIDRLQYELH